MQVHIYGHDCLVHKVNIYFPFLGYQWTIPENRGFNRTRFQLEVADLTDWFSFLIENENYKAEDAYGLLNWYYTPWPNLDDEVKNKDQLGQVGFIYKDRNLLYSIPIT